MDDNTNALFAQVLAWDADEKRELLARHHRLEAEALAHEHDALLGRCRIGASIDTAKVRVALGRKTKLHCAKRLLGVGDHVDIIDMGLGGEFDACCITIENPRRSTIESALNRIDAAFGLLSAETVWIDVALDFRLKGQDGRRNADGLPALTSWADSYGPIHRMLKMTLWSESLRCWGFALNDRLEWDKSMGIVEHTAYLREYCAGYEEDESHYRLYAKRTDQSSPVALNRQSVRLECRLTPDMIDAPVNAWETLGGIKPGKVGRLFRFKTCTTQPFLTAIDSKFFADAAGFNVRLADWNTMNDRVFQPLARMKT